MGRGLCSKKHTQYLKSGLSPICVDLTRSLQYQTVQFSSVQNWFFWRKRNKKLLTRQINVHENSFTTIEAWDEQLSTIFTLGALVDV